MSVHAVTWLCNRCGATESTTAPERFGLAPYPRGWRRGLIPSEQPARPDTRGSKYDLCKTCSGSFTDWWGAGGRS